MDDPTAVATLVGDSTFAQLPYATYSLLCQLALVSGPGAEYYFAASLAINAMCAKISANLTEMRLGDFMDSSGRNQAKALQETSERFLQLYYNTPAWAIIEDDLSDLNALIIIRNYVLRTNP